MRPGMVSARATRLRHRHLCAKGGQPRLDRPPRLLHVQHQLDVAEPAPRRLVVVGRRQQAMERSKRFGDSM